MSWFRGTLARPLTFIAIFTFIIVVSIPAHSYAKNTITAKSSSEAVYKTGIDIDRQLASEIVSTRLLKLGLSEAEIDERINALSDEELHHFASNTDQIYPGSGIGSVLLFTIIVLAAAYAYIKVTGKRVVIE